jgi:1-acyl-sn-glycerol-3-phosphate acyltransferase
MSGESTAMYFAFLFKEVFPLQIVTVIALFIAFYIGWKGRSKIIETSMYHISDSKFSVVSQKHSAWFDWSCFSKAVFKKSFVILKLPTFRAYTILFDGLDQAQIREIKEIITSKIKKTSNK